MQVALKVVDLNSLKTDIEQKLLNNEIKALRTLKHTNIIEVYEIYQGDNQIYMVSEYCNQGDLFRYSKQKGRISEEEMVRIINQILMGLACMFSNGIIHRDLKTANILLKDGVVKIADFGFCGFLQEMSEALRYSVGSPLYMSPEAYKKNSYSPKSDLWALGMIVYELILGEQPFRGYDYDSMVKSIAVGEIYRNVDSPFLRMLLSKLFTVEVERRPEISEVLTAMKSYHPTSKINYSPSIPTMEQSFKKKPPTAAFFTGSASGNFVGSTRRSEMPTSQRTKTNPNPNHIPLQPQQFSLQIPPQGPQQPPQMYQSNNIQVSNIPINNQDFSAIYQLSTVARPQSSKPFLISFDSNLSTFSNASIRYDTV